MTGGLEQSATAPPTLGERLDDLLARAGAKGTFAQDAALAVAAALVSLVLFWALAPAAMRDPGVDLTAAQARAVTAIGCVQALLLCLRRTRPALCLAAIVVCQVPVIVTAPDIMTHGLGPMIATYTVAAARPVRATAAAVAAAVLTESAAAAATALARDGGYAPATITDHATSSVLTYGLIAFAGAYAASRRRQRALERERAAAAIRSHRERAEAALGAERSRIARELHDVAAHHLSGMVVQAAAVERLIDRDTASAKSGAAWIRSQGKATLENLRQVVGLLREHDGGGDGDGPVPGLSMLPALVEEARGLGSAVAYECRGEPLRPPPIADISLYRIAQQALANARQHAPGAPVAVSLDHGDRGVTLEVVNGPSARGELADVGGGGSGLVGMRERAELVGAGLEAGPTGEGGWRVRVDLPVPETEEGELETGVGR
ncbi:sensor histidine kinase [Glycomyces xiaoerkulensis]|uniref:sensor histidine kinase n=1 Tax=Glycomyces xiaoerkulensis TaxID=2038139 RepID=UPI0018E43C82|nr:histidine kinase [Glycomyces xiaoerkulensis]